MKEKTQVLLAVAIAFILIVPSFGLVGSYSRSRLYPVRVACVGDSLTELTQYPQYLQKLLGEDYCVLNLGSSGAASMEKSGKPYMHLMYVDEAKSFYPNVIVIFLGTNDAHEGLLPFVGTDFKTDYTTIVRYFEGLASKTKIYLVLPPPIFDNIYGLNGTTLDQQIIPAITEVATEGHYSLIDLHTVMNNSSCLPDGVHPNMDGVILMTQEIYKAITSES
ncbi:MAG: GDSL-type esterase/lipase family protein [Candidatus Bathyarchaeota archaeon]|nr:GDSL-type esterase/lipase family protein [Candidatus Bathyarchaeota archaeon]